MSVTVARLCETSTMLLLLHCLNIVQIGGICWWQSHPAVQLVPSLHCSFWEH